MRLTKPQGQIREKGSTITMKSLTKGSFALLLAAGLAVGIGTAVAQEEAPATAPAIQPEQVEAAPAASGARVGTLDMETAFQQHPGFGKLMQTVERLQADAEKAQETGNMEQMQQLQMQFEQQRTEAMQAFEADIQAALPQAAKAANVQIVALEYLYVADEIEQTDLTAQVIELFPEAEAEPVGPALPETQFTIQPAPAETKSQ